MPTASAAALPTIKPHALVSIVGKPRDRSRANGQHFYDTNAKEAHVSRGSSYSMSWKKLAFDS